MERKKKAITMYRKIIIILSLLIILVAALFGWRYYEIRQNEERLRLAREAANAGLASSSIPAFPTPVATTSPSTIIETNIQHKTDMFESLSIASGDTLPTGAVVKGSVRGNWYFEASFPVELKVGATTIWSGVATAGSDWMTTNFVPFSFTPVYTTYGTPTNAMLILKKDNPSGEPINDDELQIPVVLQ